MDDCLGALPYILPTSRGAESRHSQQAQTKLGNLNKADARGCEPVFCANAAKVGSEAKLRISVSQQMTDLHPFRHSKLSNKWEQKRTLIASD